MDYFNAKNKERVSKLEITLTYVGWVLIVFGILALINFIFKLRIFG